MQLHALNAGWRELPTKQPKEGKQEVVEHKLL